MRSVRYICSLAFFSMAVLLVFENACFCQTLEEITTSNRFLFGYGTGKNFEEADKNALANLSSQISVNVESRFILQVQENGNSFTKSTEDLVQTYSGISLQQAKSRKISEKKGEVRVIRYIGLKDLDMVIQMRIKKTYGYFNAGILALEDLRISDALRNFYWTLVLLQSIPGKDTLKCQPDVHKSDLMISTLPNMINKIFSDLEIKVSAITMDENAKQKNIDLAVSYKDRPAENFDFTYWTGEMNSNLISTTDGRSRIELIGSEETGLKELYIKAEYQFQFKTKWDDELKSIYDGISLPQFDKAVYKLKIDRKKAVMQSTSDTIVVEVSVKEQKKIEKKSTSLEVHIDAERYAGNITKVIHALQNRQISKVSHLFTAMGFEMMTCLLSNGKVTILPNPEPLKPVCMGNRVEFRSVPMRFSFANNRREFIENVVFSFDSTGLIDAIAFSLGNRTLNDIISRGENFGSVEDKYTLIRFLENYKTAYALKRVDYIDSIFAENALIIVGRVLKSAERLDNAYRSIGDKNLEYVHLSKQEYIERLRNIFRSNEFVNIQFEETIIKKMNDKKIYGIQLEQHYSSTNYADKGYLFLMIDLRDSAKPKIYVRTWQPTRNEDGSVFGLQDFHF